MVVINVVGFGYGVEVDFVDEDMQCLDEGIVENEYDCCLLLSLFFVELDYFIDIVYIVYFWML